MKIRILPLMLIIGIILTGCKKDDEAAPDPKINAIIVPLLAGENMEVGTLTVWNDKNKFFVKYTAKIGFTIKETRLHTWEPKGYSWNDYFHGFPFTSNTKNPDVGRFTYNGKHNSKMEVEYEISLESIPESGFFAVAAYALITSGLDIFKSFAEILPETASVKIMYAELGAQSYFPQTVVSNTGGFLDGKYCGWCAETRVPISQNRWYDADIFSSLEDLSEKNILKYPENINKVNWIINQRFVGNDLTGTDDQGEEVNYGLVTYGDVQYAIWDLISTLPPDISSPHNMDRVNEIVRRAESYADFFPEIGGIFALICNIENAQNILIEYPVPYYEEEAAWGKGEYFNDQEKRAMYLVYEFL